MVEFPSNQAMQRTAHHPLALCADVDFDYFVLNCSAASIPEQWLSFVSLGTAGCLADPGKER